MHLEGQGISPLNLHINDRIVIQGLWLSWALGMGFVVMNEMNQNVADHDAELTGNFRWDFSTN
jgi:hypothetical protein